MNLKSDQIRDILKNKWPDLKYIWLFDTIYTAIDVSQFEKIIKPVQQKFHQNKFDCDKFAMTTHVQVALEIAADDNFSYAITFGQIMTKHLISKQIHAVNILIDTDLKINLYEPQGGYFINGKNMQPFFVRI